jgi:tRNA (guanine37-N1)-methyltransferase
MTVTILTLFPGLFRGYLESSILARAIARDLVGVKVVDIRDFALDKHHVCDDTAYGGGPGMVMKPEPIAAALEASVPAGSRVIYLTPAGRLFTQAFAEGLARGADFALLCGRYEGIDQRVIDSFVTDEISIGDYVLSGGETAAMVVVDSVARLVPGVITGESLQEESFSEGLLEYPHYTRPEEFRGRRVPEVLLSGHHEKIRQWRLLKSVEKTLRHRPELLDSEGLSQEARDLAGQIRREGDGHGRDEGS